MTHLRDKTVRRTAFAGLLPLALLVACAGTRAPAQGSVTCDPHVAAGHDVLIEVSGRADSAGGTVWVLRLPDTTVTGTGRAALLEGDSIHARCSAQAGGVLVRINNPVRIVRLYLGAADAPRVQAFSALHPNLGWTEFEGDTLLPQVISWPSAQRRDASEPERGAGVPVGTKLGALGSTIDTMMTDHLDDLPAGLISRLWTRFDSTVLAALNGGQDVGQVNALLARLPYYKGPGGDTGVAIGHSRFYREPPRDAPTYFVAQLGRAPARPVVGVFAYPWVNGPSRSSVYARREGRWQVTDSITDENQLEVRGVHSDSEEPILAVLSAYMRADGRNAHVRLFTVRNGRLLRQQVPLPDTMDDGEVDCTDSTIEVAWATYPRSIAGCVMCTHLWHSLSIRPTPSGLQSRHEYLNPWVEVVDRYFSTPASRRDGARLLVVSDSLERTLRRIDRLEADRDSGSVSAGWGFVELSSESTETWWRIEAQRRGDAWIMTRVVPGERKDHDVKWLESKAVGVPWHPVPNLR